MLKHVEHGLAGGRIIVRAGDEIDWNVRILELLEFRRDPLDLVYSGQRGVEEITRDDDKINFFLENYVNGLLKRLDGQLS